MLLALCEMEDSLSIEDRYLFFETVASKSAKMGASMLLTPELSFCGYNYALEHPNHCDEGFAISFFSSLSKKFSINIGFGYISKDRDGFKNSYAIVSKDGGRPFVYNKIHIFSHSTAEAKLVGGDMPVVAQIDGFRIGIAICYDLRFAELFLYYASKCDAIIVPSAWPKRRIFEFKSLLCARAIESRCDIFAINYIGGSYAKRGAFAYHPTGRVKKAIETAEHLSIFELKKGGAPLLDIQKDRKKELYEKLLWL